MSKRILVIDDDKSLQKLFRFILTDEGWEVFGYDYAHAALKVVWQLRPDLIILDLNAIQAGVGWSFLQLLSMEDTTAAIPLVVCTTASNLSVEVEGYLAARRISIVRKPFDVPDFILTIKKNLVPDLALPILVVEDNNDLCEIVVTILQLSGYVSETASSGLLALDAVAKAQYSLILLDIEMPNLNGLEFLKAYAQQLGQHSPVIIFSGKTELLTERLPEFVVAVLPKPYKVSDLVTLVSKYAQPVSREARA